ncbi:MAG: ribonuclease III [Bacteroidales bacterium]|nr:ribonuclease III [Bacteroidales bacterium]
MFSRLRDRIKLLFRKEKELYLLYRKILGFYPDDLHFYQVALLHKSSSVRSKEGQLINNERLEFLGDSVLQSIVSAILYRQFRQKGEGFLTKIRSRIVQRDTLNRIAIEIGLDHLIKFSGNLKTQNTSIPGNAFEALVGAIYLDKGYDVCYQFINEKIISRYFDLKEIVKEEKDFKSQLMEWGQQKKIPIRFELIYSCIDSENNALFETQVFLAELKAGKGEGTSKKKSHQKAAFKTLDLIHNNASFKSKLETLHAENSAKGLSEDLLEASRSFTHSPTEANSHPLPLDQ